MEYKIFSAWLTNSRLTDSFHNMSTHSMYSLLIVAILSSVSAFAPLGRVVASVSSLEMTRFDVLRIPLSSIAMSTEMIPVNNSAGRKPLMGGNWKLNPRSVAAASSLTSEVQYS